MAKPTTIATQAAKLKADLDAYEKSPNAWMMLVDLIETPQGPVHIYRFDITHEFGRTVEYLADTHWAPVAGLVQSRLETGDWGFDDLGVGGGGGAIDEASAETRAQVLSAVYHLAASDIRVRNGGSPFLDPGKERSFMVGTAGPPDSYDPVFCFEREGRWVLDPYVDQAGRFGADPAEYGLSSFGASMLSEINNRLHIAGKIARGDAFCSDGDQPSFEVAIGRAWTRILDAFPAAAAQVSLADIHAAVQEMLDSIERASPGWTASPSPSP